MPSATKRPFWLHQLAEYIVGGALLATGLQSSEPIVPVIVGLLIIVNTAVVDEQIMMTNRIEGKGRAYEFGGC